MSLQSNDRRYRLGFIGGGKLAGSVMRGLVRAKFCAPAEIFLSEPHEVARTALREELGIFVTAENAEVAEQAEVILIGVKPGVVLDVVAGIAGDDSGQIGYLSRGRGTRGEHGREGKGAVHASDDEYAGRGLPGGDGDCARDAHDKGRFRRGATDFFVRRDGRGSGRGANRPRHGAGGEWAGICLHSDRSAGGRAEQTADCRLKCR